LKAWLMVTPEDKPHPYQKIMISLSTLFAVLYAASFFHRDFRILYNKYLDVPSWLSPLALAICGFTFGMGLGGLVAPESFWKSRTGQKWLLVGDRGDLWWQRLLNRWKCCFIVVLFGTATEELIRLVYIDF
jgi:hypothetical protein